MRRGRTSGSGAHLRELIEPKIADHRGRNCQLNGPRAPFCGPAPLERATTIGEQTISDPSRLATDTTSTPRAAKLTMPPTPAPTCICGPRHGRQADSGEDRSGDDQPPTSLPKEPTNGHTPSLARRRRARLVAVARRRRCSDKAAHSVHRSSDGGAKGGAVSTTSSRPDRSAAACADEAATDCALNRIVGVGTGR